ncbi:MAG: hypothetical protein IJZ76_03725 [Lachnospiraceae bacterium]|nr:hypothetical protein [Lachnospiraceae bacterium]
MIEEKTTEQINDDVPEKRRLIAWIKENRMQLLLLGVSAGTLIMTVLGIKNKDAIIALWNSLKRDMKKGILYSEKWFENAGLDELEKAREIVRLDYVNPDFDTDYRNQCRNLLSRFDNAIGKLKGEGKEVGYPIRSSHGWYLSSDG